MTVFAAHPGTMLINIDPDEPACPVIGWAVCGKCRVLPLVLGRPGGLVTGDAIEAESGHVSDLITGVFYPSEGDWRDDVDAKQPYSLGLTHPLLTFDAPVAVAAPTPGPVAVTPRPSQAQTVARTTGLPKGAGIPHVTFGGKVYSKQSFWQAPPTDPVVVFVLEPSTTAPISGAVKITRDEYYAARKTAVEVHQSVFSAPRLDEPEPPLNAAEEDDDDDSSSLI